MTSVATTPGLDELTGTYTLDRAHSRISFVIRQAMLGKIRGTFETFRGTAVLDGRTPTASSAEITIAAMSINTQNDQRDAHLRSNDFLALDQHPYITFVSTGVTQVSETKFELAGHLTIKDVRHRVTVLLTYMGSGVDQDGNQRVRFEGSSVLRRRDYGITKKTAPATGSILVADKIGLEFDLSAIKYL